MTVSSGSARYQNEAQSQNPVSTGFLLDIFLFSLIIPPLLKKPARSRYDVGNNSTKKQSQTETLAGIQVAHEQRRWQESHQPPQGQGKKTSRRIVPSASCEECRTHTEKASGYEKIASLSLP